MLRNFSNTTYYNNNYADNLTSYSCRSPYPNRHSLPEGQRVALIVCYALLTPMTLLFNGFLIYGLIVTKQYLRKFSRFILVLSISDFAIGLIVQPTVIYLFLPQSRYNCGTSWFLTITAYILLNFSGMVIFLVSIDRFFRLRKSQRYIRMATLKRINLALLGAFMFSVLAALGTYMSTIFNLFCYYNMFLIVVNSAAAGGILFFYLMAWRNVKKQIAMLQNLSAKNRSSTNLDGLQISNKKALKKQGKSKQSVLNDNQTRTKSMCETKRKSRPLYDAAMTRTVAAILLCCCTTYPPYFAVSFYRSLTFTLKGECERESHATSVYFFWSFFLMFVNCVVNAVLYSCHNRQLKELLKNIRRCGKDPLFRSSTLEMSRTSRDSIENTRN